MSSYFLRVRGNSIYTMHSSTGYLNNASYYRAHVLKFGIDYSTFTMSRSTFMCEAALNAFSDTPTETWADHSGLVVNLQRSYELHSLTLPFYSAYSSNLFTAKDTFLFVSGSQSPVLATAGCVSSVAGLDFSSVQTFFELVEGAAPLVIDATQFLGSTTSCYMTPQIISIACTTTECSAFATISGSTITLTAPTAAADHKQHSYEIFVTMQDAVGQQILPIRFGYRSFTTTSHLTPTHSVDSCKDAVYPLVFGNGAQYNDYK